MADIGEKAYAAGLFDGEGTVQLYFRASPSSESKKSLRTALSIAGTDLRPLAWLQERWGGRTHIYERGAGPLGDRPLGRWTVHAFAAESFAQDIQPYLIVKREQLDLWLYARTLVQSRGRPNALSEEEIATRRELVAQVKALKRAS